MVSSFLDEPPQSVTANGISGCPFLDSSYCEENCCLHPSEFPMHLSCSVQLAFYKLYEQETSLGNRNFGGSVSR